MTQQRGRPVLRFFLARLQKQLRNAEAKRQDKADALVQANERTFEPLEEEWNAARERVRCIKAAIARVEERLARPPLLWWITSAGRYDKHYRDGYAFAVEKLKTNSPQAVLSPTLALSPFESDAFHDGARAAVADHIASTGQSE